MTHRLNDHSDRSVGSDFALEVWQRRRWLALLTFCAVFAGAVSLALSLPDLYRATATVLVERQEVSEAFVRPSVTAELETRIQTIHQQVMSRARLSDVITRLGLYPDLRGVVPIDAIVERMRRDIQLVLKGVEQTTGRSATIAFTISYSGRDPATVAQVANTLVEFYVEENTKSRERQAAQTAGFLKEQLAEIKRELDEQERRSSAYKLRHTGELPQQVEVNLAALERLNTRLRLNGEYQIRAMERRDRLERELADAESVEPPAPQSVTPVTSVTPATELVKLKAHLAELRRKFSDRYPEVIRVKAELAILEEQAAQAPPDGDATPEPPLTDSSIRLARHAIGEVDGELQTLKKEEEFLRQVIAGYEGRVENAPKRQEELEQLSRDYATSKERYDTLSKRYEEAQLASSLEQGQNVEQFRILDPAIPPVRPAAPNRLWLLVMGFMASIGLGFGAIVAAERLDTTFHTVDDLRAFTNVPALAAIRRIPTKGDARRQRFRFALATVAAIVGLILIVGGSYYIGSGNDQIVQMTVRGRG